jgi:hypothetical protein
MPLSRLVTVVKARLIIVAEMIDNARIPGTQNVATHAPVGDQVSLPKIGGKSTRKISGKTTVKKVAAGLRRNDKREYFAWANPQRTTRRAVP